MAPLTITKTKGLSEKDRRRLNGVVERIIQKGASSPQEVLELVRSTTQQHRGEHI